MPFVKVYHGPKLGSKEADTIRMGSHLQSDKAAKGIYIAIGADVVEKMGWPMEDTERRRRTRISVNEGAGSDAGFLMLAYDASGYVLGSEKNKTYSYNVSVSMTKVKHYVLNECPVPVEDVQFSINEDDKTILIECPDWLRYNSLSYQEPEKEVAVDRRPLQVVPKEDGRRRRMR